MDVDYIARNCRQRGKGNKDTSKGKAQEADKQDNECSVCEKKKGISDETAGQERGTTKTEQ